MTTAPRLPSNPILFLASAAPWGAAFAVLGLVLLIVVRSCGYEIWPVLAYGGYFAAYVALPGVVALQAMNRGPVSLTMAIALGVPTGFALEIFSFLGLAAIGAKALVPALPLLWAAVGVLLGLSRREWPLRCRWTLRHGGLALAVAVLFLATAASATTQMFAESPLVSGFPQRPVFHDWVYLVSRAAGIKNHWPLEDPSLAGTPLEYHYFMLVHVAAASLVTKVEGSLVLLRFVPVTLGAVLAVQAYALGRLMARSAWGGVLAALMTVAISEVSFAPTYNDAAFLGLFIRWLYVSPTFFFGMIFFGALLLAVAVGQGKARLGWTKLAWLALLAAAGTGAKGTMTPVLLVALAVWFVWSWIRTRRFPARLALVGVALGAGFFIVYLAVMSSWGTGEAKFEPFRVLQVTGFWERHFAGLQKTFSAWLPSSVARVIALGFSAVVVVAGTAGVRLLAIAQMAGNANGPRRELVPWFAAAFLTAAAMGLLFHLHVYSELYFILMTPLPMAVLAAGFIIETGRHFRATQLGTAGGGSGKARFAFRPLGRSTLIAMAVLGLGLTLTVQCGLWVARHRQGLALWLRQSPHMRPRDDMMTLRDAMLWIRKNTELDAILVANAFTPKHLQRGRGDLVDSTTAGVHFYYSAFSERRLFVEGPTYLHDTPRVNRRLRRTAEIFYEGKVPLTSLPGAAPGYAVIDRSLNDGARIALPERDRVFTNARFDIYRLPRNPAPTDAGAVASLTNE